jgi:hypothetical protein
VSHARPCRLRAYFVTSFITAKKMMTTVLANLDPGSGSMMLQVLAGGIAAAAVTLKVYWRRLLVFLRIKKPQEDTATAQTESPS